MGPIDPQVKGHQGLVRSALGGDIPAGHEGHDFRRRTHQAGAIEPGWRLRKRLTLEAIERVVVTRRSAAHPTVALFVVSAPRRPAALDQERTPQAPLAVAHRRHGRCPYAVRSSRELADTYAECSRVSGRMGTRGSRSLPAGCPIISMAVFTGTGLVSMNRAFTTSRVRKWMSWAVL